MFYCNQFPYPFWVYLFMFHFRRFDKRKTIVLLTICINNLKTIFQTEGSGVEHRSTPSFSDWFINLIFYYLPGIPRVRWVNSIYSTGLATYRTSLFFFMSCDVVVDEADIKYLTVEDTILYTSTTTRTWWLVSPLLWIVISVYQFLLP